MKDIKKNGKIDVKIYHGDREEVNDEIFNGKLVLHVKVSAHFDTDPEVLYVDSVNWIHDCSNRAIEWFLNNRMPILRGNVEDALKRIGAKEYELWEVLSKTKGINVKDGTYVVINNGRRKGKKSLRSRPAKDNLNWL
jgi:hypothetical protein